LKDGYKIQDEWIKELTLIMYSAGKKHIEGYLVSNVPIETLRQDPPEVFKVFTPLSCDPVAIKTAARANPTLFLIKKGTIINKWSYADLEQALLVVNNVPGNAADGNGE
jgi:hypothetical protein